MDAWPFPQSVPTDGLWDDILIGGKDGLFVVVLTLAWWSVELEKTEDVSSQLDAAILDVSWVLSNLVLALSIKWPRSPSSVRSPSRLQGARVGPPPKRLCLSKS